MGIALTAAFALPAFAVPVSWTTPVTVSATADAWGPQLATAPDGSITAVWAELGASEAIMSSTSFDGGTTWTAETTLSLTNAHQRDPQIAIDAAGVRTVVWSGEDGIGFGVETASSADGQLWTFHQVISFPGAQAEKPKIAIDPNGLRFVLWHRDLGGVGVVQSTTSTDGQIWAPTVDVSTFPLDSRNVDIAVRGNGNAVAIWTFASGLGGVQTSATTTDGTSWTTPVDLVPRFPFVDDARIIVSSSGIVAASWNRDDGFGNTIVQAVTSPDGQNWPNPPTDVSAPGADSSMARIAFAPDGTLHAAWSQIAADSIVRTAHSVDAGATWSPLVTISPAGDYSTWPTFAIDSASNPTLIWLRDDFSGNSPVVESTISIDGGATFPLSVTIFSPPTSGPHSSPPPQAVVSATDVITAIWVIFTGPIAVAQVANSVAAVPPPAPGPTAGLAATGSALVAPLALLGSGLIAGGVLLVRHRRRAAAHRA
jgi:hypothetical protein